MKQNMMIVCYDYNLALSLGEKLSEFFSMRVFDELSMLSFDFAPLTLSELIEKFDENFVLEHLKKTVFSYCSFENVIGVSHLKVAALCEEFFGNIKENNLTVLVGAEAHGEDDFFNMTETEILDAERLLSEKLCDIVVDGRGRAINEIFDAIIEKTEMYYKNLAS